MSAIDRVKELLAAASPGPWRVEKKEPYRGPFDHKLYCGNDLPFAFGIGGMSNARLAALAPLLAEELVASQEALARVQSLPLLMKSWEKSSRDAAYDEIQAALRLEKLEAVMEEKR